MGYIYSRWTGAGGCGGADPDDLMAALAGDLLAGGDVDAALNRLASSGVTTEDGEHLPGVDALLEELHEARERDLQSYNLDSAIEDVRAQVDEVLAAERGAVDRLAERGDQSPASGQASRTVADRRRAWLDGLPADRVAAIPALAEYEFLDGAARAQFTALTEMLQRHVVQTHFAGMTGWLDGLSARDVDDLKSMLRDLGGMLDERLDGREPDFPGFMASHGQHFPGVHSLDELLEVVVDQASDTEALTSSMSPEMRNELDRALAPIVRDVELRNALGRVAEAVTAIVPPRPRREYPFCGSQSISLDEALGLMQRMQDYSRLEEQLTGWKESADPSGVDLTLLEATMGEEARSIAEMLISVPEVLHDAGYIERRSGGTELTVRGVERLGRRALADIFARMRQDAFGRHATHLLGPGGDRSDGSRAYEWGDALFLDLPGTVSSAVRRSGPGTPVRLRSTDFQVYRSERTVRASTVLMLDMSRSMPLRGLFASATRVALALDSLIRIRYPRDELYIVGFANTARRLEPQDLCGAGWTEDAYGTNMQHGFMLARRLLGRNRAGNRQIILITDGEPTAHLEDGRVEFSYPPVERTYHETLREVQRCTREEITINTFMLERSHALAEFVHRVTEINRGRAFFTTPERLGDYILVDYVTSRGRGSTP